MVKNSRSIAELAGSVEAESLPERFILDNLLDGRLRIVEPIKVRHMVEGNQCVAEATELNEFGFGHNLSAAIKDLQEAIAELYMTLESEQKRLGPDLARVWSVLSRKVHKADAANRA